MPRTIGITPGFNPNSSYGQSPDSVWNNTVFRAKLKPLRDLADDNGKKIVRKPEDDLLDKFQIGDRVEGLGKKDKGKHSGNITRIKRDIKGDGFRVFIKGEKGEGEIELFPSSTVIAGKRETEGKRGSRDLGVKSTYKDRSSGSNQYTHSIEEKINRKYRMKHLKEYDSFFKK